MLSGSVPGLARVHWAISPVRRRPRGRGPVLALALVADALGLQQLLHPTAQPATAATSDRRSTAAPDAGCGPDPFTDGQPWRGLRRELPAATRYAVGLAHRLAVPMLLAVVVAALVLGLVPDQLLAALAGPDKAPAVPLAAVAGAPFYVSTEAFLPVAAALHRGGMALGATFALVISAAGINLPELAFLGRFMHPVLLVAYATAVIGTAIAAGYLIPILM